MPQKTKTNILKIFYNFLREIFTSWMKQGHAFIGEPAVEICRYSSDANFTVNLLCSMFGIDYYNILEGPSNELELLQFFEEALEQRYEDRNPNERCYINVE